jgi:glycosyltransferase involved in cell wall biosynthesis
MIVANDMINDPRVARHAETLGAHGFRVTVACLRSKRATRNETRRNYDIVRASSRIADLVALAKRRKQPSPRPASGTAKIVCSLQERKRIPKGPGRLVVVFAEIALRALALARVARDNSAHVYCANDLETLPATIIAAGFDRKIVYDSHELWPDMLIGVPQFYKRIACSLERLLIKRADTVMTVNELIANELASRYSIKVPIYIYNCPVQSTGGQSPVYHDRAPKIALYQGIYHPERGLENLVVGSEYLLPDVQLVFRGYGPLESELRRLASGMSNVRFEPPVPMESLVEAAKNADIGLVPYLPTNLNNCLASPNKLFEYIAAGLPLAVSDVPFMRKLVRENDIGVLFDANDPQSIARAINQVTRTSELHRYRKNVLAARRKYGWHVEAEKLLRSYAGFRDSFSGQR